MSNHKIAAIEVQAIKVKMKAQGLRITPQRFAVYANLLHREDHPTVEAILTDINRELPIASKASVYSALTVLREVGLVREVLLDEGITRYDARVTPHHHFICQCCGTIVDLDWDALGVLQINHLPPGLQVEGYETILKGRCDRC
ncbi:MULTISPECIES: Fur family transcriptional regulator [Spirulina sp. CCY15215]|uniref:Fur family transcriptional regulator n=1 Tax=Spirulina sp. CCY15215 TaxID=2767591 RepID=UPI001EF313EB|nr:Fur family transcriptional regulator [Spirulina major]